MRRQEADIDYIERHLCQSSVPPPADDVPEEEDLGKLFGQNSGEDATSKPSKRSKSEGEKGDKSNTPTLDKYGTWLNRQAREGKLDPVYGRDKEIGRMMQILARKKKNNPVLLGEPGVGKTAVVEALAIRIESNKVPATLLNKQIVSIDMASMVAGSMYRGQFEERIKRVIAELKAHPNIILYIDEIHTLIGSGNSQGGLDAANILKPALSRGEIKVIGATTLEEYRKSIEKDGAMERRFQKVLVEAPDADETLKILQELRESYGKHHSVTYSDEVLKEVVRLSDRYVTGRFFPDKAIDAMDEAGAYAFLSHQKPVDFKSFEDKIALADELKRKAVAEGDYELAIKYREEGVATKAALDKYLERAANGELLDEPIPVEISHVQHVISLMSGVPAESFTKDDLASLSQLSNRLKAQVKGQDHVIDAVASAIQRNRIGLRDPKKPIGTFLFLGSSGVGKTHLAKHLAIELFGSEEALIRIDMSEFMERHSVSRLVGSPPGYVGYDEGGQLTKKVKQHPYCVVLLDEIEKAHPDVHNLLLQLLDDGILTDSSGSKVSFKNSIIIMTSNVGTRQLDDFGAGIGFRDQTETDMSKISNEVIQKMLRKTFAPEFINRIDKIITFNALNQEVIREIVDIQLEKLDERLHSLEISLSYTDKALVFLAEKGFDPKLGARPLNRAIAQYVEELITQAIIDGEVVGNQSYLVDVEKGRKPDKLQILQAEPSLTS